ncbi:MAG: PAS domain S-box protein [bacterium]
MTMVQFLPRVFRRANLTVLLVGIAVLSGVALRVRYLQHEMMTRWRGSLDGGAVTTQATVDEWFADRKADAEALAVSVALHAAFQRAGDGSPPFVTVLAPVTRREKFIDAWVVDSIGAIIAGARADTLLDLERASALEAIAKQRTIRSAVVPLGPHAALLAIAAPVRVEGRIPSGSHMPAAVVLRTDIVKAFSPWAVGRPNAAMSVFSTPAADGPVIIAACPEQAVPVCIDKPAHLANSTPTALALARKDTFGIFQSHDGNRVLAVTRFDDNLGWGVIRRVNLSDAVVPLNTELKIEGAFLVVLLALAGVGAVAANRTVRVRRLYAQREATERLSIVVDASTDGIISFDKTFAITMVNAPVERMLGYPRASLTGRPVFTLFAAEWHAHLAASLENFARSAVSHAPLEDTERCIALCADGRLMPVDARVGRAVVDGLPLYVMGLRDVTERARAEMFLKGQRHALEMIASGAPSADTLAVLLAVLQTEAPEMRCTVYELDEERQIARALAAPGRLASIASAIGELSVGPSSDAIGSVIHGGESVFSSNIATDSHWTHSRAVLVAEGIRAGWAIPLRAASGHVIGALACYFDEAREPTDRERELARTAVHLSSIALSSARDAASLRNSEASFRSFVENAPAAIFRERNGEIVSTNAAMLSLLGYADVGSVARAAEAGLLYQDASARARLLHSLETNDEASGVEMEWRRSDGTLVAVRVSARAYRDERGDVWLLEGYAENVTSLRAAEGALRRSERLAAVGQLISGVAHELNNPLSSIMHFAEDLLQDERSCDDAEALGVIRDQARRSRAIVRDLLSFVRKREANAQPMSLGDIVAGTARAMGPSLSEMGVRLHFAQSAENAIVLADRSGVEQIVANLVSNAAHAAGRDGEVWVRTETREDECCLIVEDSGPGIPPEVLPRIFDPFFTTKQTGEGTGLGLSVTLGIVEQLGGRITVAKRNAGPGTCFSVLFSRMEPDSTIVRDALPEIAAAIPVPVPAAPTSVSALADSVAETARVALIIDDEPTIRAALRRFFLRRGWVVEEAADGGAGLALLEHHGDVFGLVVSDLRMPGFSGIELHDQLAAAKPALLRRFVFSTGDVASAEAASFVQRTSCPVLQKPFELRMLDEIIAAVGQGVDAERVIS